MDDIVKTMAKNFDFGLYLTTFLPMSDPWAELPLSLTSAGTGPGFCLPLRPVEQEGLSSFFAMPYLMICYETWEFFFEKMKKNHKQLA